MSLTTASGNRVGSSPLARGTLCCGFEIDMLKRLIPARAGNTRRTLRIPFQAPAHPRSRGEHWRAENLGSDDHGSSPLARGTQILRPIKVAAIRLIPARAGNTLHVYNSHFSPSAHPRSRGEHLEQVRAPATRGGSSPLARGTLGGRIVMCCCYRLIPARAGNTIRLSLGHEVTSAHPRSRGEHAAAPVTPVSIDGSSPLARGTQANVIMGWRGERLIPARAGNTPE